MSAIIDKPFSWAKRIYRAVFRGSPNLITTSDLNRQIEALKKEMLVLQEVMGVVRSDMEFNVTDDGTNVNVEWTVGSVFYQGVKFENIALPSYGPVESFPLGTERRSYFLLRATKTLVTYEDDATKEISGAKFADGTTQAAADHYVYNNPRIQVLSEQWYNEARLDENFDAPSSAGTEDIICLLAVMNIAGTPSNGGQYPAKYYLQKMFVPYGKTAFTEQRLLAEFRQYNHSALTDPNFVPNAQDTIQEAIHKLWSRQYCVETEIFKNVYSGGSTFEVSGSVPSMYGGSTWTAKVHYVLNGPICYIVVKFALDNNVTSIISYDFILGENMPPPVGTDKWEMHVTKYASSDMTGGITYDAKAYVLNVPESSVDSSPGISIISESLNFGGYYITGSYPVNSNAWVPTIEN